MARTDIEDAFIKLGDLIKTATPEAVKAAQNAAADVYVRAAQNAAPAKTGQLKQSIKKIEGRPDAYGNRNVYAGAEKKKGYYGYFVEKGHKTVGARRVKRSTSKKTGGKAHSQRGIVTQRMVPARPWFKPAVKRVENEARIVAEKAFYQAIDRKDI